MNLLKYFISFILSVSPLTMAEESEAWVSVERNLKRTERVEEDDPSIWVLVLKTFGNESIQVRFPEDPLVQKGEEGFYQLVAESGDESYQLNVEPAADGELVIEDLIYHSEGKWVREHFVQTKEHFYRFKTLSSSPESVGHDAFISSFSIEKSS